jgi:hypothetical protein
MVRHKIVRTLVVAASLVAMVIGSMSRAFLFADEFSSPSSIGLVASPQWDLTTLTVYDSNDASVNVTVDTAGSPVITASVDQDASSGTFAFSMVADDGFESMFVSGEVLADGSISYQMVKANLAGATSSAGGAAAWAAADSEPGFWDDYWRYLWNPSDMDPELEVGFYVSAGVGVTAGTIATGGIVYYGPAAALPTVFGGGAAATGGGLAGAGGGAATTGGGAATAGTSGLVGGTTATTQRLAHICANARHNLTALLKLFNQNQAAALAAVENATITALANAGITSGTFEITVVISGMSITVRGIVENGIVRIGTFFM